MNLCSVDDCLNPATRSTYCNAHYLRWLRYGDPLGTKRRPTAERFWGKVEKTDTCWLWTRGKNRHGYGLFFGDGKHWLAHRYAYTLLRGQIEDGAVLDHACHTPSCVNPDHLRPCTQKQNSENLSVIPSDNKSGARGVCWSPTMKRWRANVGHNKKQYSLGSYLTVEEADAAVRAKRLELFTHNVLDRRPL